LNGNDVWPACEKVLQKIDCVCKIDSAVTIYVAIAARRIITGVILAICSHRECAARDKQQSSGETDNDTNDCA
jgi:hypothetical protein